jgi:hypothetical protein
MADFQTVDPQAVFVVVVDNLPSAGDSQQQYRPRESPAKHPITGGAADAVGTLRCSSGKTNAAVFSAVQPNRPGVLVAASNALVAEEQALGELDLNRVLRGFKSACTRISVRQTNPLVADRGANSRYPSSAPSGSASRAPAARC